MPSSGDWRPAAPAAALAARARLNRRIRAFFEARGVLEVETPLLARHGVTDPHIDCIPVPGAGFLQSSPEYHMKRLLAAGSGPIYQITRAFRDGEQGPRHNREFSMLEWYRPGFDMEALIDECLALFDELLNEPDHERWRYREIFHAVTGLDPLTTSTQALERTGRTADAPAGLDRQALLDWLLATRVEPALPVDKLVVIHDFPPAAAALSRIEPDRDGEPVARRFEVFHGGRELANGYEELTDAAEQARRFAGDRQQRRASGRPEREEDPWLLAALEAGLPSCAGVAVGLDRLLMARLGTDDIAGVIAFPADRA